MAKCDLTIELDEPRRQFAPGEQISGKIHVLVDKECRCDGLEVVREWSTHGRGNRTSGSREAQTIFSGQWQAGQSLSYPFSFEVPNGPYSYHGSLLNVDWYIRARADIPWALDPKAELDFLVGPSQDSHALPYNSSCDRYTPASTPGESASSGGGIGGVLFSLPFLGGGLFAGWLTLTGETDAPFWGLVFAAAFTICGGFLFYNAVRNWLAKVKLGGIDVDIESAVVPAGEQFEVRVEMKPASGIELHAINVELVGKERVVSGSGTNRTTHTQAVYHETQTPEEAMSRYVDKGETLALELNFDIPRDAPPSFYASDNEVVWSARVHVDVARWPDWIDERVIEIHPPRPLSQADPEPDPEPEPAAEQEPAAPSKLAVDDEVLW